MYILHENIDKKEMTKEAFDTNTSKWNEIMKDDLAFHAMMGDK